jgi:hypothetical protein
MQGLFLSQKTTKFSAAFLLATAIAVLAGCSAGGSNSPPPPAPTGTSTAATIQLSVSLPQILSTSTSTSVLTAIVLDSTGQAITGKVVTFSTGGDTTAYYTNVNATTNANGVATATLNIGSNMANRTITVSATADAAVGTTTVKIVGTTITISGNTSLTLNASTALTVSVKNSSGVAVPGVTLTVTSANGNTIVKAPLSGVADSNGQIVVTVTATLATTPDTITVTGAGATQTQALAIMAASSSFVFTAPITIVPPAITPEILVNTPTTVSVLWTAVPAVTDLTVVNFYTTRGTITASATTTAGVATVSILAASTGATILEAVGQGGAGNTPIVSLNVVFVTITASTITEQANPSTILVNTTGSTANQSVISVVVRDAALNLVKNANVSFNLAADPSGGRLSAPIAVTDIAGTASVNYIAGGSSSGVNQVQITARVDSINGVTIPTISTSTTLTVAGQSYYVQLQTDNTVQGGGVGFSQYTKNYYALVTDSAGHAVVNTTVGFTLRPMNPTASPTLSTASFFKGQYNVAGTAWVQTVTKSCSNEDLNQNGILDKPPVVAINEDTNANGKLDPYGVAVVNITATTDTNGYATASITYNKNYAYWIQLVLEARTLVSGNDPPALVTVLLPGAAADYSDITKAPPGQVSPYGAGASASCADML